ncbi:bacteriohemerythrin [Caminibacter sp.]
MIEIKKVAFEPMNEIHENETKILEKLLEKIEKKEPLEKIYEEFLNDVKNHFSFEEKLMDKYDFFAKIPHKMEHTRIINELEELKKELDNYELLKKYFYEHFLPWLDNHIATMDTVTGGFFNMVNAQI